jgi:hypothetical protein
MSTVISVTVVAIAARVLAIWFVYFAAMGNVIAITRCPKGEEVGSCPHVHPKLTKFTTVHCFSGLKNSNNNQNVDTYIAT